MYKRMLVLSASLVSALLSGNTALTAPTSASARTAAIDLGPARNFGGDAQITLTVALKLTHTQELEGLVKSTYDSSSPNYRHFLTPEEFSSRFGPTSESIQRVTKHFEAAGLKVTQTTPSHLSVTGRMSSFENEFGLTFHTFQALETANTDAYQFRLPSAAAKVSAAIAGDVEAVVGLDNRTRLKPMNRWAPPLTRGRALRPSTAAPNTPDPPGDWTVADFAKYYDVLPLYHHGITGSKRTIGIVTFAAFTPSDAFAYWASLALHVDPNRITIVNIDGGPGSPSDASRSEETTLDVEQSGGLAPGAKIIVYQAPNTAQGYVDAFASAINGNQPDAISVSWGNWEEFSVQGTPVSDPDAAGDVSAMHNLFIQAALQGQSLSAAAGDEGSYAETGGGLNNVLSVDYPAADPYMVAGGGTTLPGEQVYSLNDGSPFTVNIPQERAWSWDYLNGLCAAIGEDPTTCGIFPVGGGGGVSVAFPLPIYQYLLPGIRTSEPHQVLTDTSTPPITIFTLPSHFAGRNLPDISFNADPNTGYTLFYTSSSRGFEIGNFGGGTSFVAPQLAGITVLLDQNAGGRVGLLNFALYTLAHLGGYSGSHAPLRDIKSGNNEFYNATAGYDQASGLGVLDVANLADILR